MKRLMIILSALFLLVGATADDVLESRRLYREAQVAYQKGDYGAYLDAVCQASALRPAHPDLLYVLASAFSVNGKIDQALATLNRLADMGMVYQPEKEPDFDELQTDPRFARVCQRFQQNALPRGSAPVAFTIPARGLVAEGLAYDAKSERFFVGSVRLREIHAVHDGVDTLFAKDLPCGVFGLAVDPARNILWAACSNVTLTEGAPEDEAGASRVLALRLQDGSVIRQYAAPDDGEEHLLGDLTVAPNGDVFVSDSRAPLIYRIREGAMSPVAEGGPFESLQGLAVMGDALYVSDYSTGLYRIDLETFRIESLSVADDVVTLGIDGIYAAGDDLIAVQNGTRPMRVLKLHLDREKKAIDSATVLSANQPALDDPTLGVVVGETFYLNGNSGWGKFDREGHADPDVLEEAKVVRVPIG